MSSNIESEVRKVVLNSEKFRQQTQLKESLLDMTSKLVGRGSRSF